VRESSRRTRRVVTYVELIQNVVPLQIVGPDESMSAHKLVEHPLSGIVADPADCAPTAET